MAQPSPNASNFTVTTGAQQSDTEPSNGPHYYGYAIAFIPIIGAIVSNGIICLAVLMDRKLRNKKNCFLVSLALTDIMICALVVPVDVIIKIRGVNYLSTHWCKLWSFTDTLLCSASIWHVCFISIDRYKSLKSPYRGGATRKLKSIVFRIACIWLVALAIATPQTFIPSDMLMNSKLCWQSNGNYIRYMSVAAFYFPLVIIATMYGKMICSIERKLQLIEEFYEIRPSGGTAGDSQPPHVTTSRNKHNRSYNAIRTLVLGFRPRIPGKRALMATKAAQTLINPIKRHLPNIGGPNLDKPGDTEKQDGNDENSAIPTSSCSPGDRTPEEIEVHIEHHAPINENVNYAAGHLYVPRNEPRIKSAPTRRRKFATKQKQGESLDSMSSVNSGASDSSMGRFLKILKGLDRRRSISTPDIVLSNQPLQPRHQALRRLIRQQTDISASNYRVGNGSRYLGRSTSFANYPRQSTIVSVSSDQKKDESSTQDRDSFCNVHHGARDSQTMLRQPNDVDMGIGLFESASEMWRARSTAPSSSKSESGESFRLDSGSSFESQQMLRTASFSTKLRYAKMKNIPAKDILNNKSNSSSLGDDDVFTNHENDMLPVQRRRSRTLPEEELRHFHRRLQRQNALEENNACTDSIALMDIRACMLERNRSRDLFGLASGGRCPKAAVLSSRSLNSRKRQRKLSSLAGKPLTPASSLASNREIVVQVNGTTQTTVKIVKHPRMSVSAPNSQTSLTRESNKNTCYSSGSSSQVTGSSPGMGMLKSSRASTPEKGSIMTLHANKGQSTSASRPTSLNLQPPTFLHQSVSMTNSAYSTSSKENPKTPLSVKSEPTGKRKKKRGRKHKKSETFITIKMNGAMSPSAIEVKSVDKNKNKVKTDVISLKEERNYLEQICLLTPIHRNSLSVPNLSVEQQTALLEQQQQRIHSDVQIAENTIMTNEDAMRIHPWQLEMAMTQSTSSYNRSSEEATDFDEQLSLLMQRMEEELQQEGVKSSLQTIHEDELYETPDIAAWTKRMTSKKTKNRYLTPCATTPSSSGQRNCMCGSPCTTTESTVCTRCCQKLQQRPMQYKREHRASKVLGLLFSVFAILWLPHFILQTALSFTNAGRLPGSNTSWISAIQWLCNWLRWSASLVNPLVYIVFNAYIRRIFSHVLLCRHICHSKDRQRSHNQQGMKQNKMIRKP